MRILWLFGPPGVGKSVTSWELLTLLSNRDEPTSYVDIDQLGMADPAAGGEGEVHRHKAWALAAVSRVHAQHGATTLVVSGVLDPGQMEFYRRALADFDLALVRLTADDVVLRRRVDARGHYAEDWSGVLADARRHEAAGLEAAGHSLPVVHTDSGSPSEVVSTDARAGRRTTRCRQPPPVLCGGSFALLAQESWSPAVDLVLDTTSLSATDTARMVLALATTWEAPDSKDPTGQDRDSPPVV